MRLQRPIVCLVTRARGTPGSAERGRLLDRLARAVEAGVTLVQVRERQLDDRRLRDFVRETREAVAGGGGLVIVNDRTDVAMAAGAAGVHLKSDGPSGACVRRIVPPGFLVGRSVHRVDEARAVEAAGGCDYLLFGTVFRSVSKADDQPIAGVDALAQVCGAVSLPVVAIGGIDVERSGQVARSGAAGVAAISLFADAGDIAATVRAVRDALTPPTGSV